MAAVPIEIRDATAQDEPVLRELRRIAFAPLRTIYVPSVTAIARAANDAPHYHALVAQFGGRIVGTAQYRRDGDRIHIRALAVHAECRRLGVARSLIDHCADLARLQGVRAVSAYTIRETGNVAIFARMGFTCVHEAVDSTLTAPDGALVNEVYLERPI